MLLFVAANETAARSRGNTLRGMVSRRIWRSVLACLVAACGALAAGAASAQSSSSMPAFKVGEWDGSVFRSADGSVEACAATNRKPDQFPRAYVSMDTDGEIALLMVDKRWGPWKEGGTVPVRLVIDDRTIASYDAEVFEPQVLAIVLQRNLLLSSVMPGSHVAVETERGIATVAINGVPELFTALDKCVASRARSEDRAAGTGTVLTCRFGNENSNGESLSCTNLTGFSLKCRSGAPSDKSATLTVRFDEENQRILGRGAVSSAKFTDTEISWEEPLGDDNWRFFTIERFSGAITMYGPAVKFEGDKEKRIPGQMWRLATGTCQIAKDRLF